MHYRGLILVVLFCAASIAACVTITEVMTVWKDDAYTAQPKRILVLAMFKSKTLSMMVEDEFLINLKSRKIDAVASYDVFPGYEFPTREMVVEQVRAGGYDAVLLTRFIDIRMEQRTVPGTAMAPHYGMPMSGYYDYGYTALYSPTYVVDEQHARIAADLYDAATEKLVWSSLSATKLSGEEQTLIQNFVAAMMGSLREEKIVP
jgi:hypothetical protein